MRILFCSNYFTHHQRSLSDRLDRLTHHNYLFLAYKTMESDRKQLGWGKDLLPCYVLNSMSQRNNVEMESDVLLVGSFPEKMLKDYIKNTKLFFHYSERPLKQGNSILKYPLRFLRWHKCNPPWQKTYMLCASAFTAIDYKKFGLFRNRCYKWGYFPETRRYEDLNDFFKHKNKTELLWCGRFLDWKHPDDALWVASQLKKKKISFRMRMIGTGPMEEQLKEIILQEDLEDCVEMPGSMMPEKVRDCMEEAGIFLFTSDRQEGWGAVVNEAMNSGCAVVASHIAGSVPYLIEDKRNGRVYCSGNKNQLLDRVLELIQDPEQQYVLGKAAYHTITDVWNAEVASQRLIDLSEHILAGEDSPVLYASGPCSPAEIIKESWYRE